MSTRQDDGGEWGEEHPPGNYQKKDNSVLRWVHPDTGLEVGLVRDSRPSDRRMTPDTATRPDDDCWIMEVRPNEYAEIYRRLGGGKRGALETALEWMADHPDGQLGD